MSAHCRHYFAYGSNMNPERMRAREVRFESAVAGHLPGFRLAFDKMSRDHHGSGHACFRVSTEDRLEGVLYHLSTPDEIRRLDVFERTPVNYSRELYAVQTADGPVVAWTYVANPAVLVPELRPEPAYLAHLIAGAEWLSEPYLARLRRQETAG